MAMDCQAVKEGAVVPLGVARWLSRVRHDIVLAPAIDRRRAVVAANGGYTAANLRFRRAGLGREPASAVLADEALDDRPRRG